MRVPVLLQYHYTAERGRPVQRSKIQPNMTKHGQGGGYGAHPVLLFRNTGIHLKAIIIRVHADRGGVLPNVRVDHREAQHGSVAPLHLLLAPVTGIKHEGGVRSGGSAWNTGRHSMMPSPCCICCSLL